MAPVLDPPAPSRDHKDWLMVVVSFGLAATITSGAGLLRDQIGMQQQRCSLSEQILGDESPSPALSVQERQMIARRASIRLQECLGDGR